MKTLGFCKGLLLDSFPYRVKSHFFDQDLVFHDRWFSRLTTCPGHITVLPDKLGHYWPQHVLIKTVQSPVISLICEFLWWKRDTKLVVLGTIPINRRWRERSMKSHTVCLLSIRAGQWWGVFIFSHFVRTQIYMFTFVEHLSKKAMTSLGKRLKVTWNLT